MSGRELQECDQLQSGTRSAQTCVATSLSASLYTPAYIMPSGCARAGAHSRVDVARRPGSCRDASQHDFDAGRFFAIRANRQSA